MDLFKAPGLAFSLQRIWIQFIGLILSYAGYYLLTLISFLLAGFGINEFVTQFGFFPCLFTLNKPVNLAANAVFILACIYFVMMLMIANTAVSRSTFMSLRNDQFYSWRDALQFAFKKSGSVVITPIAISFIAGLTVLFIGLAALSGKISFIGELSISLFTVIWIFSSMVLLFLFYALGVSLFFTPSVLAVSDEDGFESIYQSLSLAWRQPLRLLFYEAVVIGLSVVGFLLFALFVKGAVLLMNNIFLFAMQEKYLAISNQAQYFLQNWMTPLEPHLKNLLGPIAPWVYFTHEFQDAGLSWALNIAAHLMALNLLLVGALLISYLFTGFNSGTTLSYILLYWQKEGENILKEPEDELVNAVEKMAPK